MQVLDRKLACWVAKLAALFAILGIAGVGEPAIAEECPPEAPRYSPNALSAETCPDIGRMGSLKLAIPRNYILGPDFVYEGEDIWKPDFHKDHLPQSFDREIRYFSVRIRFSNFEPIRNEEDLDEFERSLTTIGGLPPVDQEWVLIQFNYPSYFRRTNMPVNLTAELKRYIDLSFDRKWPLRKLADQKETLDHYVSRNLTSIKAKVGEINEIFYNSQTNSTLITCSNITRYVAPYDLISSCEHQFFTEDGSVEIQIGNIWDKENYLRHWRETESGVVSLFRSFVTK